MIEDLRMPEGVARAPGPAPDVAWNRRAEVPVSALAIDRSYQRGVSEKGKALIRQIVADFDAGAFQHLTGYWSGERFALIDGQHRAIAAWVLGLATVPCDVVAAARPPAEVFLHVNRARIGLRPFDKWTAAVAVGEPAARDLAAICEGLELMPVHQVPRWSGERAEFSAGTQIGCIGRAWSMTRKHGRAVAEAAIGCLQEAEQTSDALLMTSAMVSATCLLVAGWMADPAMEDGIGDALDALAAALAEEDAEGWQGRARKGTAHMGALPVARLAEVIDAARLSAQP